MADPRGARITVRELLNHTSGITDRTLPEKSLPQPASLAAAVVRARSATLASDPGTTYAYTNTNFHLAARLVEVVAGQPFGEYLRTHVFEPAGMSATTSVAHTPAPGYKGHVYAYGLSIPAAEPRRFVDGSDGVITTARDMARWLIVQNGGTGLVSARGLTAMHTATGGDSTYALGWDTGKDGRIHHNGVWFTATASALLLPSGYGIAVLGTSGIGLGNEGTDQLADALATLVTGGHPGGFPPVRATVDAVLAVLTALSLALGLRNLRRTRVWATRTSRRAATWRLPFRLIPLALLLALPGLLGPLVGGGRDITFAQVCFYSPALVAWAATAATLNATVLATRATALVRAPAAGDRRRERPHGELRPRGSVGNHV